MTTKQLPRGIRNNNPGNIKELPGDKTQWLGERATDDDPIFEEFESAVHGLRALMIILLNYQKKHNLRTVRQIIDRWAPPCENETSQYARTVMQSLGYGSVDTAINLASATELYLTASAIVRYENGAGPYDGDWYQAAQYREAALLAYHACGIKNTM